MTHSPLWVNKSLRSISDSSDNIGDRSINEYIYIKAINVRDKTI